MVVLVWGLVLCGAVFSSSNITQVLVELMPADWLESNWATVNYLTRRTTDSKVKLLENPDLELTDWSLYVVTGTA